MLTLFLLAVTFAGAPAGWMVSLADPARGEHCADAAGCGCHTAPSSQTPMVGSVIAGVAWLLVRRLRAGVA